MGIGGSTARTVMDEALLNSIKEKISSNCVVIYEKPSCPYCRMAKKVFEDLGVTFVDIDINKEPNTSAIQDALLEITGARSVPRVFVGGKCIGGGSETKALHASGELQKMIKACEGC
ncbi:Glutaredoxin eukaryotic/virial [Trinorchestia longiramus]|nr:Glutaredoxin eukaryotic/virial [Trinorchestia longiramus]